VLEPGTSHFGRAKETKDRECIPALIARVPENYRQHRRTDVTDTQYPNPHTDAPTPPTSPTLQPCEVTLFTDSEYLRQGITQWLQRWKANNWRTADRQPVKNDDLWRQLDEVASGHSINWQWLKGHAGNPDNERYDQLAGVEIQKIRRHYTPEKLAALREAFVASRDPPNQGSLF